MHLQWKPAASTSAMHAAWVLSTDRPVADPERWERMQDPVAELAEMVQANNIPAHFFWRHLLGHADTLPSNRELATVVLHKTLGANDGRAARLIPALAGHIDSLENAMAAIFPNLDEELSRRAGPLQEQWEARGPGLLRTLAQLTDERLLVAEAKVLLVQPIQGGGGAAHLQSNAVRIEAVLANPDQALPEAVRLAWLLAQLNCDLPMFSETIPAERLEMVASLALLPATLTAAEEVEWVRYGSDVLAQAMVLWEPPLLVIPDEATSAGSHPPLASIVQQWWTTYQAARPRWPVALAALHHMLPGA